MALHAPHDSGATSHRGRAHDDGGHGGGAHSHGTPHGGRALGVALGANGLLLVVQIIGALLFGSLALLADSVHQASDVVSLVVALVALRLAGRPGSASYTYGLLRVEVLGALVNAVLLLAAAAWIVVEAVRRLGDPMEIDGAGVVVLALVGLAVNGGSAFWVWRSSGSSLNLRSAGVHLAADAAGSFAVLLSGVAVLAWDVTWVDPALSFLIAGSVAALGVRIVARTTQIFLEAAPGSVDLDELEHVLRDDPEVQDVHHVHVWALDSETVALTAHVVADPPNLHGAQELSERLEAALAERGVGHATLALECHPCEDPEAPCDEAAGGRDPERRPGEGQSSTT